MTKIKMSDIREFYRRRCSLGEQEYSEEVLAFSFLLGLPPEECIGMYVETDWDPELIEQYDDVLDMIIRCKKDLHK